MSALPPRENRVLQAADALKGLILSGSVAGVLPGERELSRRLGVGRVTVGSALQMLEQEGVIAPSEPGRRRRVLKGGELGGAKVELPAGTRRKTVVVLCSLALSELSAYERLNHNRLGSLCSDAGIRLRHRALELAHYKRPHHRLQEFVRQNPADLYILQLTTSQPQLWFQAERIPAMVAGTPHPSVDLPFVDVDQRALGVHAASMLERLGHRRVALLYPEAEHQGMRRFHEGMTQSHTRMDVVLGRQNDSADSIVRVLPELFEAKDRPSALILPRMPYLLSALTVLPSLGLRVPQDVSLLCLVHDRMFEYARPTIAGYQIPEGSLARGLFQLAVRMLTHPSTATHGRALIMPDYVAGGSLVACSW
ncbi:substrate-binding domain-containing protein [Sulfuriroseicoccus oceanibius]|uniref:Substrate-binding domain-containing protein n=1 Tax=Sulfuriroseicoccus oceanibius TaxID=2707525 RepID=A0A6B3LG34_9BACT|nr:substrate-binding domain-containing protein [Sulfuriroseicoccus oceanibius]QQL44946.1 substrate-binding domain-containing protein [Sulfuriroseicoccus oceanibius]